MRLAGADVSHDGGLTRVYEAMAGKAVSTRLFR